LNAPDTSQPAREWVEPPRRADLNGRRRLRAELAAGAKWVHSVPAVGPGNLTRTWRRALASILRTADKPARALAARLGDPIGSLPLAVEILAAEVRRVLEAEAPGGNGKRRVATDAIAVAFKRRGLRTFDRELREIRGAGLLRQTADAAVAGEADLESETEVVPEGNPRIVTGSDAVNWTEAPQ
jgi:hypothetical protein